MWKIDVPGTLFLSAQLDLKMMKVSPLIMDAFSTLPFFCPGREQEA